MDNDRCAFLLTQGQGKELLGDYLEYFLRWAGVSVMVAKSDWDGQHLVGASEGRGERPLHQGQPEPPGLSEQRAGQKV